MTDRALIERMAAFMPAAWRCRVAACGGAVHDADGLVVCLTGVPLAPFNPTLIERVPAAPDAAIERAEAHYDGTGLALGIDLELSLHRPVRAAARRSGLTLVESRPGMMLDLSQRETVSPPEGLEVFRVEDPALLDEVVAVDASAFGGDADVTRRFLPDAVLQDPAQRVYAARVDGRLVSVGESTTLEGVIGVFGIATDPAYRRRGIGAAVTAYLLADRAHEADLAVLDASDLGYGVYERLGFRPTSTWEVWVREAPSG